MRFERLDDWLSWQETLHPVAMDLTLERATLVADRLGLCRHAPRTVLVAGTNGKGSVATRTAALLQAMGLRTGLFTSPHLVRYNERIRINGVEAEDDALCRAFDAVDRARGEDSLTYFEFAALAAGWLFREAAVDVQVLEVGLGGRLDATNIWDADIAVITAVDLDHQKWLGDTREAIGAEKAGILREARPLMLGDPDPPDSVQARARLLDVPVRQVGEDYDLQPAVGRADALRWCFEAEETLLELAPEAVATVDGAARMNLATAMAVVAGLGLEYRLDGAVVVAALCSQAPGRLQRIRPGGAEPEWLLDVAHNGHAVAELARWLRARPVSGPVVAAVAVMADKERAAMWAALDEVVDHWVPLSLDLPRALPAADMAAELAAAGVSRVEAPAASVAQGLDRARELAGASGRVVVFGSFHTVAAAATEGPAFLAEAAATATRPVERVCTAEVSP
ncbi:MULTISPECIES: folylpolyglutamate synthase/dihydrofolate synthase family protein [unclassified Thioalkalivibrio]|uniref:bifunctional folylpolyglutamate synthase/dihydrofolate synthase n=1 Tax=unclassified Thioalkalivibrio TaxID=2621013 RepID=UPI00035FE191|nr:MULTISPECIES: folylpolyglutamate synthase/dihydrofolate synthase family protein [unclassified Thioalkalivibrio]